MAENTENGIFLLTADPVMMIELTRCCAVHDWNCVQGDTAQAALSAARDGVALVMIDDRIDAATVAEVTDGIRALPGFAAGTPVIQCGPAEAEALPGIRGRIALPWTADSICAAIEQWAGPMDAHAMRRDNDPRYRLTRLLGRAAAEPMLDRFASALDDALAQDAMTKDEAHRLAGLAGMLGFAELSALWSQVERADSHAAPDALHAARIATQESLSALRAKT